ncbi:ADP compounds hydrolase NudE [Psychrosphaera ytuae]|uniref:ADP compounds hydrolase NudE n=1 Tax=Psychrosphaera ytuae TaxID=2820710 RepID=A0A975HHB3_9GAMM|nr:ADP compounds hydrolase NudE [Psychrosphaera ytuae]QTH62863.1 ADP compounds hydrolase NudE [Psychrosphaera ytuae]
MSGKQKEPVTREWQNQTLPEIESAELVAQSKLFKIEQIDLTFANGEKRIYERMKGSGRGAVMVVPCLNDDEMMLVREYAAGTHTYELGFPKGLIDAGETPEEAANRELKEEIGFGARRLTKLKTLLTAPTYSSAKMHIFIASDLYEASLPGDEPEPLEKEVWSWSAFQDLMEHPDFNESRSVSALLMAKSLLKK